MVEIEYKCETVNTSLELLMNWTKKMRECAPTQPIDIDGSQYLRHHLWQYDERR